MRHIFPFLAGLAVVGLVPIIDADPGSARAGWGAGGCFISASPASVEATVSYTWVNLGNAEQAQLMLGTTHCGTYWLSTGVYYPRVGQGWGAPCPCPAKPPVSEMPRSKEGETKGKAIPFTKTVDLPGGERDGRMPKVLCDCCDKCGCGDACECTNAKGCNDACSCGKTGLVGADNIPNFGVDHGKVHHQPGGRYTFNGREITADQAFKSVFAGTPDAIHDDSKQLRLTLIGSDADTGKVMADLNKDPALAAFKDQIVVQSYRYPDPATDVMLKKVGFICEGTPSIYVQTPDGKVKHRQSSYQGPVNLADAIRKADPNYDPTKDPDLTKKPAPVPDPTPTPAPSPAGQPNYIFLAILAAGGFVAFYLMKGK